MKFFYIIILFIFIYGCKFSQQEKHSEMIDTVKKNTDSINDISDDVNCEDNLVDIEKYELNKIYTDTVIFKQYMDYGDFYRFRVTIKDKDLYPVNDSDDRSLARGDIAVLKWKVDSIWNPDASDYKWLSEVSVGIHKIGDGKLSQFRKKYPLPITYYYSSEIEKKYSKEDFDEIYNLVEYYLANSKQPLVKSAIENQSDSQQIQYSIEEQNREEEEDGNTVTYTVIGLSNYFENRNPIFQWLYLKQSNYGYKVLYEYDLPNGKLALFN